MLSSCKRVMLLNTIKSRSIGILDDPIDETLSRLIDSFFFFRFVLLIINKATFRWWVYSVLSAEFTLFSDFHFEPFYIVCIGELEFYQTIYCTVQSWFIQIDFISSIQ